MSTTVMNKRIWWSMLVVVPLLFVSALNLWFISVADLRSPWLVSNALMVSSPATSPTELPSEGWRDAALPNFVLSRATVPPSVWYRMDIVVERPQREPWAIYLVGPSAKYSVFVNGQFVGQSGRVAVPMPQYVAPQIFRFPGSLLRERENRIEVHSASERPRSVLQSVHVGPDIALTPTHRAAFTALSTIKQVTVMGLIAMGIVMLVLTRSRSREAVFGWYAIALFFMAAHIGIRMLASVPFGEPAAWKNGVDLALIGYMVCSFFFVNRLMGLALQRLEKWVLLWGAVGGSVLMLDAVVDSPMPWFFNRLWLPAALPICIYQTWRVLRIVNRTPDIENRLLALLCVLGVFVGLCDGQIGMTSLSSTIYLPYVMGPVLCVFWFMLLRRFVRAVNAAESARRELEQRVREKSRELEESLVRMKDMERERALSEERERIMRDMHDGVGAQLVQALSIATSRPELKSIEEPLRGCLEELRLIIDSIEPVNGDLASVLGTLRMRMTRRLKEAAIHLRWRVDDIPLLSDFGPSRVLHVSRIVHEAIANALKHARANQITLSARMHASDSSTAVIIEVADDGIGEDGAMGACDDSETSGRGLDNMRRRAAELNAQLDVDFGPRGTTVRLRLPVDGCVSRESSATQALNLAYVSSAGSE